MNRFKELLSELPKGMMSEEMIEVVERDHFEETIPEDYYEDDYDDTCPNCGHPQEFCDCELCEDWGDFCPYCGELYEICDCDEAHEDPDSPNYRGYAKSIN